MAIRVRLPDGTIAPSIEAACKILGCWPSSIRYHLDKYGDLSRFTKNPRVPVTYLGKQYDSIAAAVLDTGHTRDKINSQLKRRHRNSRSCTCPSCKKKRNSTHSSQN